MSVLKTNATAYSLDLTGLRPIVRAEVSEPKPGRYRSLNIETRLTSIPVPSDAVTGPSVALKFDAAEGVRFLLDTLAQVAEAEPGLVRECVRWDDTRALRRALDPCDGDLTLPGYCTYCLAPALADHRGGWKHTGASSHAGGGMFHPGEPCRIGSSEVGECSMPKGHQSVHSWEREPVEECVASDC